VGGSPNAADFLAAPSAADGQVGRGCQYPTPAASSARDRQSPRADKQNAKANSIGGSPEPLPADSRQTLNSQRSTLKATERRGHKRAIGLSVVGSLAFRVERWAFPLRGPTCMRPASPMPFCPAQAGGSAEPGTPRPIDRPGPRRGTSFPRPARLLTPAGPNRSWAGCRYTGCRPGP
jgi:hypothetical protein